MLASRDKSYSLAASWRVLKFSPGIQSMVLITLLCTLCISRSSLTAGFLHSVKQDEYPQGSLACKVFNDSTLDCSHRNLSVIPSIAKQNASFVDLSDNKIKLILPTSFTGHIQLTSIDLTKNRLINITGSPFADLDSLVYLILNRNQLSYLASTAFRGLHNLEVLDMSNNKLKTLPDGIFRDLIGLKDFNLILNQLTVVPSAVLSDVCNLKNLDIALNPFKSITLGPEFQSLTKLENFSLSAEFAEIPLLTNSTLQYLAQSPLRQLTFTWSPFTNVEAGIFELFQNIEVLVPGLYGFRGRYFSVPSRVKSLSLITINTILKRSLFMPLSNLNESLTDLELEIMLITSQSIKIEGFVFEWFPSLRSLNLSKLGNAQIDLSADTFCGLNNLETLALRRNMLTSIPSAALHAFGQTGSLKKLDLSGNSLTGQFPPNAFASVTSLEHLDLSYNHISFLNKWIESLTNLTRLFLNGGNIQFLLDRWDIPLFSLIEVRLDHLVCDDQIGLGELILSQKAPNLEILNVADTQNIYSLLSIQNLTALRNLDVSGSLTMLTEDDSIRQWSSLFFTDLTILKFARNKLKTMTELNLHKTTPGVVYIDLSENRIFAVDKNIKFLLNLQHLNLNDNQISSLEYFHDLVHLKSLRIAQNVLNTVSATFVKAITEHKLEYLDISNNPFACTCAIKSFQDWILVDRKVYLEPSVYRCDAPKQFKDLSLTQVKLDCESYFGLYMGIAAFCGLLVIFMIILAWRYRWHLRYRLFLLRNWHRMHYEDTDRGVNDFEMVNLQYDAFVSYAHQSDNDLEWVLNEMRPNLEEGPEPVRLCIGQARDFIPGTNLFDSITDAIHQSRKTIVVLSPSYVESELCYFETQHAWLRLLEESRDVLILILLEPIPNDKMTIWLRQLLCKKGYLRWPHGRAGQQLFWRCVREKVRKRTLVNRRFDA